MRRTLFVALLLLPPVLIAGPAANQAQAPYATLKPRITFVSPAWVASHAADPNVRILDVRTDMHAYFAGHVPNAVYLPESNLRGPREGLPVQYLPPSNLARLIAQAGVTREQRVVVYSDGEDVVGATLTAYALERIDVPSIMVMDGGWSAYRDRYPVSQTYPVYAEDVLPARFYADNRVTLAEVRTLIGAPDVRFVDVRPERLYRGLDATWMRNGHIPGAVNLDWHSFVMRDNPHQLRSLEEIRELAHMRGVRHSDRLVVYCGTGREASLVYVVLKHLLGYPNVRVYDGSWNEYASHSELPIENGLVRATENSK
jgi:thiosulfate/3-mercaptopyruvate sulfurtransferase